MGIWSSSGGSVGWGTFQYCCTWCLGWFNSWGVRVISLPVGVIIFIIFFFQDRIIAELWEKVVLASPSLGHPILLLARQKEALSFSKLW